jgi:peroxin-5
MNNYLPPQSMGYMPAMSQWVPQTSALSIPRAQQADIQWDKEFANIEAALETPQISQINSTQANTISVSENISQQRIEQDDLARTAGLLVDAIRDEQNPKFKNSQFLGLMRKLRDGDVVVNGEDLVSRSDLPADAVTADAKGKGKARATGMRLATLSLAS